MLSADFFILELSSLLFENNPEGYFPRPTRHAPVSVAMSKIYLGLYFLQNVSASHKTNLPSASVFRISIVIPDILVTTSPGRVA